MSAATRLLKASDTLLGMQGDRWPSMSFQAELVDEESDQASVVFEYVVSGEGRVVIPRLWWDDLGKPRFISVTVQGDDEPPPGYAPVR
jgi:hypothetical protein